MNQKQIQYYSNQGFLSAFIISMYLKYVNLEDVYLFFNNHYFSLIK